jgi:hypothetical protein
MSAQIRSSNSIGNAPSIEGLRKSSPTKWQMHFRPHPKCQSPPLSMPSIIPPIPFIRHNHFCTSFPPILPFACSHHPIPNFHTISLLLFLIKTTRHHPRPLPMPLSVRECRLAALPMLLCLSPSPPLIRAIPANSSPPLPLAPIKRISR